MYVYIYACVLLIAMLLWALHSSVGTDLEVCDYMYVCMYVCIYIYIYIYIYICMCFTDSDAALGFA
jgi:hypothetical protein